MSKYDSNNIMECFKMSVDLKKVKEIEIYIKNLEEENKNLRKRIKTIKRLRKHQTQKKNKYKSIVIDLQNVLTEKNNKINKAIRMLEINIEIAKQQPSNNKLEDEFFINRCSGLLKILKGDIDER